MTDRLGQIVTHKGLETTVVIVGMMELSSGGQVLVDWDGTGAIRWWCEDDELADCGEGAEPHSAESCRSSD